MSWSDGETLKGRWFLLVALCLVVAACSTPSPPSNGELETAPPIESESPEVQAEFNAALDLLDEGRWDEAVEAFRLLQASHSGDQTADLAELFIARALLGDIDSQFAGEEEREPVSQEVFALLEPLWNSQRVDDRIRYGAAVYLAVAHALNEDVSSGLAVFEQYPGASMSPVVRIVDRRWIWPLLAEGLGHANRQGESVIAWGKLHALERALRDERIEGAEDGESVDFDAHREEPSELSLLAVARAFEAESDLTQERVQSFLASDEPLVRAVGAWAFIRSEVHANLEEEGAEALQVIFNEIASDFLTIEAADRAAELSVTLASVSGPERLVIGALLPLSGPNRAVGYRALSGMLVAQRSFHVAGEPSVTLVIEDSHGDVVGAYERLVAEDVIAVVGPLETARAQELLEISKERNVPILSLTTDRVTFERNGDEASPPVFRNFLNAVAEARAAAVMSFQVLGDRRAAVVYPDMGYGRAMSAAFIDEFRRQGGEVVAEVAYDRESSDFVSTARRVARSNPDAIFLPDSAAKVAEITAFLAQENIWGHSPDKRPSPRSQRTFVHYLGTSLWDGEIVLHQARNYVEGALIPAWYSPIFDDAESRQFSGSFDAIYGRRAYHFEAFAYDSVNQIRSLLLDRGVPNSEGITRTLRSGEVSRGATGEFHFGDDGEPQRKLRYLTIKDGQWAVFGETVMTPLPGREDSDEQIGDDSLDALEEEGSEVNDNL